MKTVSNELERFMAHQANVAAAYNAASPAERKNLDAALTFAKAGRVASTGGLRGLFPTLKGKLQPTQEAIKNG